MAKSYHGFRSGWGENTVFMMDLETGERHDLELRLDLANHSPTGFEWGYLGSGPAQLALAILADFTNDETALSYYQYFKERFIAPIDADHFDIEGQAILDWLKERINDYQT